jgi:hypothetical protein
MRRTIAKETPGMGFSPHLTIQGRQLYKGANFSRRLHHAAHLDESFDRIGKQHESLPTYGRVERVCVEIKVLRIHNASSAVGVRSLLLSVSR